MKIKPADLISTVSHNIRSPLQKSSDTKSGELSINGNKIFVLRDPVSDKEAATKNYVDVDYSTVHNKLSTQRTEYDDPGNAFANPVDILENLINSYIISLVLLWLLYINFLISRHSLEGLNKNMIIL